MRLVVDSNILVSAYTMRGRIHEYWTAARLCPHDLIISPEIFSETERTLRKSEFGLSGCKIETILLDILRRCTTVRPKAKYRGNIADEGDRHLADLAQEVAADAILTGDHALQGMNMVGRTSILSFYRFLSEVREGLAGNE